MRIAQLTAPRQFALVEGPVAEPGPGEVQVRVEAVGICGSDLHSYSEGGVGDTPCQFPMVLGHEPAGTVVKTGMGVSGWAPGDRAYLEPAIYCYHCEFCRTGHHNVCANIRFLSTPGNPGFFREYVNLPAHNLIAIPAHASPAEATLIEPLAVALHSIRLADVRRGETAVVFGAGPIGLLTIVSLKAAGAGRVWVCEPLAHRRELALLCGADAVLDPRAVNCAREINRETGQRGVDAAFDCAAKDDTANDALNATRSAGRVVLTAIPVEMRVPIDFSPMRRKELALLNVRRSNDETGDAVRLLEERLRQVRPLITHHRPLECIAEAFDINEHYRDGIGKMIITPAAG